MKNAGWKTMFLLKWSMFRWNVYFQGGYNEFAQKNPRGSLAGKIWDPRTKQSPHWPLLRPNVHGEWLHDRPSSSHTPACCLALPSNSPFMQHKHEQNHSCAPSLKRDSHQTKVWRKIPTQKITEEKSVANEILAGHVFTLCGNISHGFSIANLKSPSLRFHLKLILYRCFIDNMGVSQIECPTIDKFPSKHGEITKKMVVLQKSFAKVKYDHFASSRIPLGLWETTIRVIILPSSGDDLWQQQHVCSIWRYFIYIHFIDQCMYIYI